MIFAKARLASEGITIPRLELLGILIGVRGLKFVERELGFPVTSKVLWTDSQCALQWLQSTKPLPVFVANRLKEIQSLHGVEFKYVPSEDNPADIATRGKTPLELSYSIWWNGPQWLQQPRDKWPKWELPETKPNPETRGTDTVFYEAKLIVGEGVQSSNYGTQSNSKELTSGIGNVIKEENISSLSRLLRITAWLLRFVDKLRKQTSNNGPLIASEINRAKLKWDLYVQDRCYSEVIQMIKQGKKTNIGDELNLVINDDGLLRCKGRYDNVGLSEDARYPKLLHKNDHYTKLVIEYYHGMYLHSGVTQTLAHTRKEYWIPQGRSQVKTTLNQCRVCRRTEGNPFRMPRMPPWPKERVNEALPFEYTGLDYFGPLYVKEYSCDTGQKSKPVVRKVWVCLFTCLVVRAVHLEIVEDMSADQFLLCLRRFIARRGVPHHIISDNAKQFKLARKVLSKAHQEALFSDEVQEYMAGRGIQWTLIVELAPWMGGFYERLVGLTKRVLRKTLGTSCLTLIQLSTILTEAEAVVNSRPLVYVGDDNSRHVLVPNDFLALNSSNFVCTNGSEEKDKEYQPNAIMSNAEKLLRVWKRGQRKLKQFWELWRNDYLLNLRERAQMSLKQPKRLAHNTPQIGDVVLIKENLPRGRWKVGVIHKLIRGKDQRIRSAKVMVSAKSYLHRALNLLYPIECPGDENKQVNCSETVVQDGNRNNTNLDSSSEVSDGNDTLSDNEEDDEIENGNEIAHDGSEDGGTRRPLRQATIKAREKLREWLDPSENFICVGSVAIPIVNEIT